MASQTVPLITILSILILRIYCQNSQPSQKLSSHSVSSKKTSPHHQHQYQISSSTFSQHPPSQIAFSTLPTSSIGFLSFRNSLSGLLSFPVAASISSSSSSQSLSVPLTKLNHLPVKSLMFDQQASLSANHSFQGELSGTQQTHRYKNPIQDKLHSAQQSLNDLFSDLLSKPLSNFASNLTFDILTDKVKFPRPLNSIFSLNKPEQSLISNNQDQEHALIDGTDHVTTEAPNKNLQNNKNSKNPLQNLVGRCFEPYGCFRITEPFRVIYRPINLVPETPSHIKVTFDLRTRSNPTVAERLSYNEATKIFSSKFFRLNRKLKLIIHGYLESGEEQWIKQMAAAWLNREDTNVISVNWMLGAVPPYTQAVANTRLVGAIIAHLIRLIQEATSAGYPLSNIHLIGHSLGAHIAGYTGEQFAGKLGRITGLDPAQPYFQYTDSIVRLDPSDALFVDVVHTDVSSIMSGGFGMNQTCGHVDFYPNGGILQPGCKEAPIKNVWDSITKDKTVFDGIRRFIGCNHLRSFLLYIEAINSECPFTAFPCGSYEEFINGQCTERLMESRYMSICSTGKTHLSSSFNSVTLSNSRSNSDSNGEFFKKELCPIRFGPNSENDYRRIQAIQGHNLNQPLTPASRVYFLKTSDRVSYCHFHYDVRILFQLPVLTRYPAHGLSSLTSSLSNSPSLSGTQSSLSSHVSPSFSSRTLNSQTIPLNGRLFITIAGTRSQTYGELLLKSPTDFTNLHSPEVQKRSGEGLSGNTDIPGENGDSSNFPQFRQHHLMLSHPDLGSVLRIELEWRPSNSGQRTLNFQLQTRALKRWLPILDSGTLPSMLNELQKTLNTSQLLHYRSILSNSLSSPLPSTPSSSLLSSPSSSLSPTPSSLSSQPSSSLLSSSSFSTTTTSSSSSSSPSSSSSSSSSSPSSSSPSLSSSSPSSSSSSSSSSSTSSSPSLPLPSISLALKPEMNFKSETIQRVDKNTTIPATTMSMPSSISSGSISTSQTVSQLPVKESSPMMPLLEGIVLTQMENGKQFVFCAGESAVKLLFQPRSLTKSVVLLLSFVQNLQDVPESNIETAQELLLRRCYS